MKRGLEVVSLPHFLHDFDVVCFEINLNLPIKPLFYMTKKSRQKFKYLKIKRAFKMKQKTFFIILKGCRLSEFVLDPRLDL